MEESGAAFGFGRAIFPL